MSNERSVPANTGANGDGNLKPEAAKLAKLLEQPEPVRESDRLRAIEVRFQAHDEAYLAAKKPALDALPKTGSAEAQLSARLAEINKRDVEVVTPQVAARWADQDARDFVKLKTPERAEEAAMLMSDNARHSKNYADALQARSPEVASTVQRLDAEASVKSAHRDNIKEAQAAMDARIQTVKGWTPEEATRQAKTDAASYKAAYDPNSDNLDRVEMASAMAATARHNPAYKAAIEAIPDVAVFVRDVKPQTRADDLLQREQKQQVTNAIAGEPREKSQAREVGGNRVGSDEIFTAERANAVPADVAKRYVRDGSKFYEAANPSTVAFEDKGNRLETKSNSEQRAQDMVRIALARGWDEIKVEGSESFRRAAWLEAAGQGMHVKGYVPSEQDKAEVAKKEGRSVTVEQTATGFRGRETDGEASKGQQQSAAEKRAEAFLTKPQEEALKKHPELAGAFGKLQVVQAMMAEDSKADPRLATPEARAVVLDTARRRVGERIAAGEIPETRIKTDFERLKEVQNEREATR